MKLRAYFITVFAFFSVQSFTLAQAGWSLKLEKDGIEIYTRKLEHTSLKAVKAVCTLQVSMTTLTAVLLDISNSKEWIYATKSVSLLEHISSTEIVYYSEVDLPWPVCNRDFIVDLTFSQDPLTKIVRVTSTNKSGLLPRYKDIVRVEQSWSQWMISPLPNGRLRVEYELQVDPGGSIPVWLTNLFATTGPFNTFQKLREEVKKPEYLDISQAFIKN